LNIFCLCVCGGGGSLTSLDSFTCILLTNLCLLRVSGPALFPYTPLALISSLLSLLQLLQSSGQTLLSAIQLLLNQLDASVQGSDVALSLRTHRMISRRALIRQDMHISPGAEISLELIKLFRVSCDVLHKTCKGYRQGFLVNISTETKARGRELSKCVHRPSPYVERQFTINHRDFLTTRNTDNVV